MRHLWILGLVLVAGCCGFNRDWKRASQTLQVTNDVAGRWEGSWMSERNGHHGRLRCLTAPAESGTYQARFHARYWKIFSFSYTALLKVHRSNEVAQFTGEADLGKLAGGVYAYNGTVAGTNWHSTYNSKYDHGYFRMNRVP